MPCVMGNRTVKNKSRSWFWYDQDTSDFSSRLVLIVFVFTLSLFLVSSGFLHKSVRMYLWIVVVVAALCIEGGAVSAFTLSGASRYLFFCARPFRPTNSAHANDFDQSLSRAVQQNQNWKALIKGVFQRLRSLYTSGQYPTVR
jgi:hypothetical protein